MSPKVAAYFLVIPTSFHSDMKTSYKIAIGLTLLFGATSGYTAPASENWENHCTKCHGDDGKGQTKAGKKLQLKDYTDAKVQAIAAWVFGTGLIAYIVRKLVRA